MLNTAVLMGRLTADPELRSTQNNISVTKITLAVERNHKIGTEKTADFIDVVCWRQTAEFVVKYFQKGQLVAVKGSIQTRTYTDTLGVKRKAFEIIAESVYFAEGKRDSGASKNNAAPAPNNGTGSPVDNEEFVEINSDDDLPF